MRVSDQGVENPGRTDPSTSRYVVIPRTLIFILCENPSTGEEEVLLIRGAPNKRLWANRYNGIGGHVRSDEDYGEAASRELAEESGITDAALIPRGVINIAIDESQGVQLFLFSGRTSQREIHSSSEGEAEWVPLSQLNLRPLVDDLPHLLSRLLTSDEFIYARYAPAETGEMVYRFRTGPVADPGTVSPARSRIRTGVDTVEIERVERAIERWGDRFLNRVFTSMELESCGGRIESLAARFAAKEALAKVLGTGIWREQVAWTDFEVLRNPDGEPVISLRGGALMWARKHAVQISSLSLSHDRERAIAFVVALVE